MGLFMSIASGVKDGMSSAASIIPLNHWSMMALSILGGLAFIVAIITIFIRKQDFWQISFYILSAIIIAKVLLTETYRVVDSFKHLS